MRNLNFSVNHTTRKVTIIDQDTKNVVQDMIWASHFPISDGDIELMKNIHNVDIVKKVEWAIQAEIRNFLLGLKNHNTSAFSKEEIDDLLIKLPKFENFLVRIPKPNEIN